MTPFGISQRALITPEYLHTQVLLHADPRGYGGKGDKWASAVIGLARARGCHSILDYGAGERNLVRAIRAETKGEFSIREYDPAIPEISALPSGFSDLVVCTDVLEHVEPDLLDNVLGHLRTLHRKAVFVVIATRPSNKTLADGRNAHLTVESEEWWKDRLRSGGFVLHPGPPSPLTKPSRELVAVLTERMS